MTRLLGLCLLLVLIAAVCSVVQAADKPVKVYVDNQLRTFSPPAITRNGKAYLPMRAFASAIAAGISYDTASATTRITYCSKTAKLKKADGITVNNSFYVPLRTVANALGLKIGWNAAAQAINIDCASVTTGGG